MKLRKIIATVLCLAVFAGAAIASSCSDSDSEETKEIAGVSDGENSADEDIKIEEQELVNQDGIVITAKEYITDSIWGDGIKLNIQNNSSKAVTVGCTALIVNNYMITDLFATEIAAGMQSNDNLYLSSSELKAAGISNVGQIEVYFHVYETDTWENIFETDCITIKTSKFDSMDVKALDDGFELYNEDGIRIVGKSVDENSFWGTAVLLYIENKSGRNVTVSAEKMSINGFMVSPVFASTVYKDKMAVDDITIFSSDLEENGITSVDEIQLSFHIFDSDSLQTIKDTDMITFAAK